MKDRYFTIKSLRLSNWAIGQMTVRCCRNRLRQQRLGVAGTRISRRKRVLIELRDIKERESRKPRTMGKISRLDRRRASTEPSSASVERAAFSAVDEEGVEEEPLEPILLLERLRLVAKLEDWRDWRYSSTGDRMVLEKDCSGSGCAIAMALGSISGILFVIFHGESGGKGRGIFLGTRLPRRQERFQENKYTEQKEKKKRRVLKARGNNKRGRGCAHYHGEEKNMNRKKKETEQRGTEGQRGARGCY